MVFEDSPLPLTQMTSAGQNVFIHEYLCGTYDLYLHAAGGFSACCGWLLSQSVTPPLQTYLRLCGETIFTASTLHKLYGGQEAKSEQLPCHYALFTQN